MTETIATLREFATERLPDLVVPIAILVVGWILALGLSAIVRRALQRTSFDDRIAKRILGEERAQDINTAQWVGKGVYYIVLLLALLGFLQATQLTAASEPINNMLSSVLAFLPLLVAAAAIIFVAWLAATLVRTVLMRALERWQVDKRIKQNTSETVAAASLATAQPGIGVAPVAPAREAIAPDKQAPVSRAVAETGYWLVLLFFVPAVLETLRLEGLLVPVQEMLDGALGFLPNIASAAVIVGVGWLVARVIQRLVTNASAGVGADRLAKRVGATKALGKLALSSLLGLIVYIMVLIPVAVGALNALQLDAITAPASGMLQAFFAAVPAIFGAALVIALAFVAGRLLATLVSKLLNGVGFDTVLTKVGISRGEIAERTPSDLVGGLVMITVLYFAALEGARILEFEAIAALGSDFAVLAAHVLLGIAIFGVGLFLGQLAGNAIEKSDMTQARPLAITTRIAILGLSGAVALSQMGIASAIIELAFGLILGAVAVAAALAFGLGGREAASEALKDMRSRLEKAKPEPVRPVEKAAS